MVAQKSERATHGGTKVGFFDIGGGRAVLQQGVVGETQQSLESLEFDNVEGLDGDVVAGVSVDAMEGGLRMGNPETCCALDFCWSGLVATVRHPDLTRAAIQCQAACQGLAAARARVHGRDAARLQRELDAGKLIGE